VKHISSRRATAHDEARIMCGALLADGGEIKFFLRPMRRKEYRPNCFSVFSGEHSGSLYDDFIRLLFLHAHHEASVLANELLDHLC
jgi:hypothetical protein